MKFLFTFLAIIHFLPLFSQQTDISPTLLKPGRFELGIVIAPCKSNRALSPHDKSSEAKEYIEYRNKIEGSKTGFESGISLKYFLSERKGISAGLYYASRGYKNKGRDVQWPIEVDSTGNFMNYPSNARLKSNHTFNTIEIPILFDYTFHRARLSYSIGIGGSFNYLLASTFSYKITWDNGGLQEESSKNIGSYHRANVSMLFRTGVSYSLNEHASIHIDPTFQYDITTLNDNPILNEHLWNFGLHLGYYMAL